MKRETKLQRLVGAVDAVTEHARAQPDQWRDVTGVLAYLEGASSCFAPDLEASLSALRKQLHANELARIQQQNRQQ